MSWELRGWINIGLDTTRHSFLHAPCQIAFCNARSLLLFRACASQKRVFRGHKTDVYQRRNDRCEREKEELTSIFLYKVLWSAKFNVIGCVNTVSWLHLAAVPSFIQTCREKLANSEYGDRLKAAISRNLLQINLHYRVPYTWERGNDWMHLMMMMVMSCATKLAPPTIGQINCGVCKWATIFASATATGF